MSCRLHVPTSRSSSTVVTGADLQYHAAVELVSVSIAQCHLRDSSDSLSGVQLSAQVGAPLCLGAAGDSTGSSRCSEGEAERLKDEVLSLTES